MTSDRRFEHDLPGLLAELAPRAMPDYRDDIVRQTARVRQRPAWMFPERWLPVSVISTRAWAAPPIPWRIVGLVALLLLAMAVGLVLVAGSQRHVPAPFGPAANGVVAYEKNGEIFTADPITGAARPLVTGTATNVRGTNVRPVFSRDGTHVVFEHKMSPDVGWGELIVARSDGTGLVVVTPAAVSVDSPYFDAQTPNYAFSPDGSEVAFWSTPDAGGKLSFARADGTGVRQLDLPFTVGEAAYRPLNGAELIVTGSTNGGTNGIYAVDPNTGAHRTIVAPVSGVGADVVRLSPDGSRLAYVSAIAGVDAATGPSSYRVHVVGIDGSNDITLPLPKGAVFQDAPAWSNDGTRLAITRGYAQHNEDMTVAVVPADGSDVGIESREHGFTGCCDTILQWSPDDTSVLVMPEEMSDSVTKQHVLFDPLTGAIAPAPWTGSNPPAWQRTVR